MIQEVNHQQLTERIFKRERTVIFFYTPLCGTCKLANQMLDVALAVFPVPEKLDVISCNINQMPAAAKQWRVQSVPCLAFLDDGKMVKKLYSFRSVDYIYQEIKKFYK
ncbi:thioredoxin family protein [Pseudalkalibacillus salsuginis]|uniref:thioredoxin family protein n=1 Tax=Pseudalkalibacillus salsuginis TaxID=2910972 RepID=UPI001F323C16|nr:thioredoxin family protein [Pseudalkalibacillus salsuginis]MCF6410394.1 thioredoxin family protein [Pseudalkalibacillus salsuginis]